MIDEVRPTETDSPLHPDNPDNSDIGSMLCSEAYKSLDQLPTQIARLNDGFTIHVGPTADYEDGSLSTTANDKAAPPATTPLITGQEMQRLINDLRKDGDDDFLTRAGAHGALDKVLAGPQREKVATLLMKELLNPGNLESQRRTQTLLSSVLAPARDINDRVLDIEQYRNLMQSGKDSPDKRAKICENAPVDPQRLELLKHVLATAESAIKAEGGNIGNSEPLKQFAKAMDKYKELLTDQAAIRIRYAKDLFFYPKDKAGPDLPKIVDQLTQALIENPNLGKKSESDETHNKLHASLIRYAALSEAGRDPRFVSALMAMGGRAAYEELNKEEELNARSQTPQKSSS
jgi:hypothetical protein